MRVEWLLVPKVEDAADLQALQAWAGASFERIAALVETPRGIENAAAIAAAGGKLAALMLGGADLSAELGCEFGWDGLLYARGRIVNARQDGGPPGLGRASHRPARHRCPGGGDPARLALGFDSKSAIHPSSSPRSMLHSHPLRPNSPGPRANAGPAEGDPGGAFLFQGRMVDAPVICRARRTLARAPPST